MTCSRSQDSLALQARHTWKDLLQKAGTCNYTVMYKSNYSAVREIQKHPKDRSYGSYD